MADGSSGGILDNLRPPERPYPGLRPFEVWEFTIFCGRERHVDQVIERLGSRHIAAIVGGSGCGKSSLVRAGVIPALLLKRLEEQEGFWLPAVFTPETDPIGNLAEVLDGLLVALEDREAAQARRQKIETALRRPQGLAEFVDGFSGEIKVKAGAEAIRKRANILVLVDQFEELFRTENQGNEQVKQLVDLIVDVFMRPEAHPHTFIVLTMRTEDMHNCAAFLDLPEVFNATSYLTGRLNESEIEEAILVPARQFCTDRHRLSDHDGDPEYDVRPFEVDVMEVLYDAVTCICNDPDHLPLLQHFLYRLWENASRRMATAGENKYFSITDEDLRAAAGDSRCEASTIFQRSVANHADALYRELSPERQGIAETMFRLLAEVDESGVYKRRWTTRETIAEVGGAGGAEIDAVIHAFNHPHPYIRTTGGEADDKIDVSHESFIRNWPRFGTWLEDEKAAETTYRKLLERLRELESPFLDGSYEIKSSDWRDDRFLNQVEDRISDKNRTYSWAKRYNFFIDDLFGDDVGKHGHERIFDCAITYYRKCIAQREAEHQELEYQKQRAIEIREEQKRQQMQFEEEKKRQELQFKEEEKRIQLKAKEKRKRLILNLAWATAVVVMGVVFVSWGQNQARKLTELEAKAFQPYTAAGAMKHPLNAFEYEESRPTHLLQLAVVLGALEELDKDLDSMQRHRAMDTLYSTVINLFIPGMDLEGREQRLQRAARLAHDQVDTTARQLIGTAAWPIADGVAAAADASVPWTPFAAASPEVQACADAIVRSRRGLNEPSEPPGTGLQLASSRKTEDGSVIHVVRDPTTGELIFGAANSAGRCYQVDTWRLPASTSVYMDPSFRLVITDNDIHGAGPDGRPTSRTLYTAWRFHWYKVCPLEIDAAPKGEDASSRLCEMVWRFVPDRLSDHIACPGSSLRVGSGGQTFFIDDREYVEDRQASGGTSYRCKSDDPGAQMLESGGRTRGYRLHWLDTAVPVDGEDVSSVEPYFEEEHRAKRRFEMIEIKNQDASQNPPNKTSVALKHKNFDKHFVEDIPGKYSLIDYDDSGIYLAYAGFDHLKNIQYIEILMIDENRISEEKHFLAMKYPIATLGFKGPRIQKIALGRDKDDGNVFIEVEGGKYYKAVWGVTPLRQAVCNDVLGEAQWKSLKNSDDVTREFRVLTNQERAVLARLQHRPCPGTAQARSDP